MTSMSPAATIALIRLPCMVRLLPQYFAVVLAELRRGPIDPHRRVGEPHAVAHEVDLAELWMRNAHAHAQRLDLWIGKHLGEIIERPRRHILFGQTSQPMVAVARREHVA